MYKKGGAIVKDARFALEAKTGKSVVTGENFLPVLKQEKLPAPKKKK
jgi:DNA-damage-inducible protein D